MSTLFLEFNDEYLRDVLSGLVKAGVGVDYLVTAKPELYKSGIFRKTKVYSDTLFNFPENILKLNLTNPDSLSKAEILDNLETEKLYLTITDRLCFYPKSVRLRQQLFCELLLYWKTFLIGNGITTVVFPRVPHLGYGNVLYGMAKYKGIRTLLIRDITIDGKTRIDTDFLKSEKVPLGFARKKKEKELKDSLPPEFTSILKLNSSLIVRNQHDNSETLSQSKLGLWSLAKLDTLKAVLSLVHWPWGFYSPSIFYLESTRNWAAYYLSLVSYYRFIRRIWKKYQDLSRPADLGQNFVYFGLHYQPERTSLPEGDIFENQLLMIDILSKGLPKNWKLYVKEHPYQFARSDTRMRNFRDDWFYEKITAYPNVYLVPAETHAYELIRSSQAVVTLTGSTGLEAMVMGKPLITFSKAAWFFPCRSCYLVDSLEKAKEVFVLIRHTSPKKVRLDLLKFLVYCQNGFVDSSTESFAVGPLIHKRQTLIENLVLALKSQIN